MVFEALISPMKAEQRPWQMIFLGALYSSMGVVLGLWIFRDYASLIMVFLTVMGCIPIVYNTIKFEEQKDEVTFEETSLLKEHWKALEVLMFLFIGITVSLTFWYVFLPNHYISNLFSSQTATITSINSSAVGKVTDFDRFTKIFFNNFKVLLFCVLFSFLYGVGAIFILVWNASVIATAMGAVIRSNLAFAATKAGFEKIAAYFHAVSYGLLKYSPHGIPEILAYFVAGLAGGIISVAIIKHTFGTKKFENILIDTANLLMLSLGILLLAAILEVYVTPLIF
ncbi:MAG: stage II sporulation protein M [Candidatus Woesearchaeota archaeon]